MLVNKTTPLIVLAKPYWTVVGRPVNVKAKLTLCDGTTDVQGQSVTLTTDYGYFDNGLTTYTAPTDSEGEVGTTLTVTEPCPVTATLTATAIAQPCNKEFTGTARLKVVCQQPTTPCEIFFCIDCTGV